MKCMSRMNPEEWAQRYLKIVNGVLVHKNSGSKATTTDTVYICGGRYPVETVAAWVAVPEKLPTFNWSPQRPRR